MKQYKIAILGGGPGGYVAAIKAAQLGAETVLIEGGAIGGVCLNEGCIPTKTLLKSAKVYQDILHSEKYGIGIGGQAEIRIDWSAMLQRKDNVVSQLTSGVENLLRQNGVDVIKGFGEVLDKNTILVNGEKVSFENLIIATGSSPTILPIPGLAEALEMGLAVTSTGALELEEIPDEVVIVGGGVVGMEFAALFNALGSKVTVLEKFTVLGSLDSELQRYMLRLLQRKGVEIYNQADVKRFEGSTVVAEIKGETREFAGDKVIVSLGRRPNLQAVEKLNLALERGAIRTNERLETSIPGVYAIGDVN
ncbi:MAG: FAD-dependent oxidoreductase, partial [Limnochordia bacterium]